MEEEVEEVAVKMKMVGFLLVCFLQMASWFWRRVLCRKPHAFQGHSRFLEPDSVVWLFPRLRDFG